METSISIIFECFHRLAALLRERHFGEHSPTEPLPERKAVEDRMRTTIDIVENKHKSHIGLWFKIQ